MIFKKKNNITHILVGLGNPGPKYMKTRHNVGYLTVDLIMSKFDCEYTKKKFNSLTGEILFDDVRILVMKPETFMNNSGIAVGEAASFYKIPPENVIVISDDISLPTGKLRIRKSGSAGGHNGLKSIISHLGSDSFPRIKIGVGANSPDSDLVDFVLGTIPKNEMDLIQPCAEKCVEIIKLLTTGQIDKAMNKFNWRSTLWTQITKDKI